MPTRREMLQLGTAGSLAAAIGDSAGLVPAAEQPPAPTKQASTRPIRTRMLWVKHFLIHAEYDKGDWKGDC